MKPYLKTTESIFDFLQDHTHDFLCCEVHLDDGVLKEHEMFVRFPCIGDTIDAEIDGTLVTFKKGNMYFPIKPEHAEDDIHQRITKAIWDGLGGDKHKTIDHCVYISAAESMDDTFYVNVVRTKPKGAA